MRTISGGWSGGRILRLAIAALSCVLVSGCSGETTAPRVASEGGWKVAVGEKMPDFRLPTLDGKQMTLGDLQGKPVVISFFATWCGPCRQEMPQLESRVWQEMKNKNVQVVAVNREESGATVKAFLQNVPVTFPILLDEKDELFPKIAEDGIPRLVVLDRDHVIRHLELGFYRPHFDEVVNKIGQIADGQTSGTAASAR